MHIPITVQHQEQQNATAILNKPKNNIKNMNSVMFLCFHFVFGPVVPPTTISIQAELQHCGLCLRLLQFKDPGMTLKMC